MKSNRTIVYIDGENLIHQVLDVLKEDKLLSDRSELISFDLRGLLVSALEDLGKIDEIRYYGTRLREYHDNAEVLARSQKKIKWSARWTNLLKAQHIEYIKSGSLKLKDATACQQCKQVNQVFQEKGVDVRIATDLVFEVLSGKVERIILVSSDADLLPALERIRGRGVEIIYLTHESRITRTIARLSDKTRTFTSSQVKKSYLQKQGKLL